MAIGMLNGFALIIQEIGRETKCRIHTHTTVGTLLAIIIYYNVWTSGFRVLVCTYLHFCPANPFQIWEVRFREHLFVSNTEEDSLALMF